MPIATSIGITYINFLVSDAATNYLYLNKILKCPQTGKSATILNACDKLFAETITDPKVNEFIGPQSYGNFFFKYTNKVNVEAKFTDFILKFSTSVLQILLKPHICASKMRMKQIFLCLEKI